MDIRVTAGEDRHSWDLTDLLGRSMGIIVDETDRFSIHPSGKALETLAVLASVTYKSLDDALAAIETHTRGVCRRADP